MIFNLIFKKNFFLWADNKITNKKIDEEKENKDNDK